MKVSKTAQPYLNIRTSPNGNKIGIAYPGSDIEVLGIENGWVKLPIKVGEKLAYGNLWAKAEFIDSTPISPTPSIKPKLGLHVMSNGHIAGAEAAKGCKLFLIMDNFLSAHQIKMAYPDAAVMVRKFIRNRVPVEDMVRALEVYPESRLVYTGHNESDVIGTSASAIIERAAFDLAMAQAIKKIAPNAKYAAGTFSRGEPNLWDAGIIEAVKSGYAPAFNSGLLDFDMHSYSNDHNLNDADTYWIVNRWHQLFRVCGFNPNRAQSIYSSETGVDNGKVQGFSGTGVNQDQFARWCEKYISVNSGLNIDGVSYNNIFVGGAIYQFGGNGDSQWNGFEASGYTDTLRRFY